MMYLGCFVGSDQIFEPAFEHFVCVLMTLDKVQN